MSTFGKSTRALISERDALQGVIDAKAAELTAKQVDIGYLVSQLVPLTTKMQRIKRAIRDRTPRSELMKDLEQIREELATLPARDSSELSQLPLDEVGAQLELRSRRMALESRAMEIDNYLKVSRRESLTWKSTLIFLAIVAALIVLPDLIGRWLAP